MENIHRIFFEVRSQHIQLSQTLEQFYIQTLKLSFFCYFIFVSLVW